MNLHAGAGSPSDAIDDMAGMAGWARQGRQPPALLRQAARIRWHGSGQAQVKHGAARLPGSRSDPPP